MNLLINIFPVILLAAALIYALKLPVERIYTFENSARLRLIHTILVTTMQIAFLPMLFKGGFKQNYLFHMNIFLNVRSHYGFLIALTYIIPWVVYLFSPLIPILAASVFYFFSDKIIRLYEKLIPAQGDNKLLAPYRESISFFQNQMQQIFKAHGLLYKPKLCIKPTLNPGCNVFGSNTHNLSIVVTLGLLRSLREGQLSGKEIEAMICHEIGHLFNGDIRLASSIKILLDLKIIQLAILATFTGLLLIYLTPAVFTFLYKPDSFYGQLKVFYDFRLSIPVFLSWFIICFLSDLMVRTAFKTREFFADAQAVRILKEEEIFIKTLKNMPLPLGFLAQRSLTLGIFPNFISAYLPSTSKKILYKILDSLTPRAMYETITKKIDHLTERLKSLFLTHPTFEQRIDAILNRTYFPTHPVLTSSKTYVTVGITIFLSFLFFVTIALVLTGSGWTFLLYLFCALAALVVVNNAHLKHLTKDELFWLRDSTMLCGFKITSPKLKQNGRKLCIANHVALLPFTTTTLLLLTLTDVWRNKDVPVPIIIIMLVMPFLLMHLSVQGFLILLSWFKKDPLTTSAKPK